VSVGGYVELDAWNIALKLVVETYRVTGTMRSDERFALVQQMRRAAVSVTSNIAEGHSRRSRREYLRFVIVAWGSLTELESQLLVARELGLVPHEDLSAASRLITRTARLLRGVERALARSLHRGST